MAIGLPQGMDLHDGIVDACLNAGIRDGVVVEGHATLDRVNLHRVVSTTFPVVEQYETLEGPYELASIDGLLIDGELHAHIVVAAPDRVAGGHLHQGTRVLYLAEIVVVALAFEREVTRVRDPETDLWLLRHSNGGGPDPVEGAGM